MEDLTNPDSRVNSEFYKKLQQQLSQKENIIKLLQLKVKNLEEERGGPISADDQGRRSDGLEKRIKGLEKAERDLQEENEALVRRAAKDEETLNDLEKRLAQARDDLTKRDEEVARLKNLVPGVEDKKYDKLWAEISVLEGKLARKDEELTRLRREMAETSPPSDVAREVGELRRETERLRADKTHLEEVVAQLKEKGPGDALLGDELLRREEELRTRDAERQKLSEENDRLRQRLEEARSHAEATAPAGSFQLVSALITLFQRLQNLRDKVGPQREFSTIEGSLQEISGLIGLERIRSVGKTVDPELHQVAEVVYSTEHAHDTVIREVSQGYTARSGVVKLAEVVISRNPYWCKKCQRVAAEGSRYCNICGEKVAGRESPDVRLLDPQQALQSFLDLARAKEEGGDLSAAEKGYRQVLEVDGRNLEAQVGIVRTQEGQGRYREALEQLERIVESAPGVAADLARSRDRLRTKMEIVQRLQSLF
ncbi:MAG: nucleotide exchange factor GrpE [Candidatus Riflebacteria bacterium]|nr:nucleotide exchange factor GrpE [Candidatus Riflebacteria bacterium]